MEVPPAGSARGKFPRSSDGNRPSANGGCLLFHSCPLIWCGITFSDPSELEGSQIPSWVSHPRLYELEYSLENDNGDKFFTDHVVLTEDAFERITAPEQLVVQPGIELPTDSEKLKDLTSTLHIRISEKEL